MILVKKPKLDYDQEENDNLRKEEDEWEWYWNCKSSLNQKKIASRVLSGIFLALGLSAVSPSFKDRGSRWDRARSMTEQADKLWSHLGKWILFE